MHRTSRAEQAMRGGPCPSVETRPTEPSVNATFCQARAVASWHERTCVCVRVCVFPCPRDVGRVRGRISGDAHTAAGRKAAPLKRNTTRTSRCFCCTCSSRLNFWYRFLWSEWKCALFSSRGKHDINKPVFLKGVAAQLVRDFLSVRRWTNNFSFLADITQDPLPADPRFT
jgi:hypothetical protein